MRRIALVAVMAALGACGSTTSVRPFGGTYDLISVDGKADPQSLFPGVKSPDVVGGTMGVSADTLTVTLLEQSVDSAGRAVGDVNPVVEAIAYNRQGDTLVFTNGAAGSGGVILGSSVSLTFELALASSTGFEAVTRRFLFVPSADSGGAP
jgi:hypothetical protein